MFYCPLHNWYSDEAPCPACHKTITTTLATSTEGTGEILPEPPNEVDGVWEGISREIEKFKQSKKPLNPDTKERIEVVNTDFDCEEKWINVSFNVEFPSNKVHKIKQAIESVLNDEPVQTTAGNVIIAYPRYAEMLSKKYTQQQLDEAIQKAFEAAKEGKVERVPVVIDQYGSVNIEEHFIANKYPTFQDYINSLNTNTKTSKHWT